jgi:hypothetical protein
MFAHVWRVAQRFRTLRGMGSIRMEPERRLGALDQWVGCWVAVKDGRVVAAAHNSRDLVPELRKLGSEAEGAVAQYVTPHSDAIMIGVG